jgi:hypothetical protein
MALEHERQLALPGSGYRWVQWQALCRTHRGVACCQDRFHDLFLLRLPAALCSQAAGADQLAELVVVKPINLAGPAT